MSLKLTLWQQGYREHLSDDVQIAVSERGKLFTQLQWLAKTVVSQKTQWLFETVTAMA